MKYPPRKIYDAVAVSSTTTYKSLVVSAAEHNQFISGESTSTATSVITVEFNDLNDRDYIAACNPADPLNVTAAEEAANTTGWKPLPVFYMSGGAMTTTGTIAQGAAGTFGVTVKKGKMRVRLSWANATGSGAVTARSKAND